MVKPLLRYVNLYIFQNGSHPPHVVCMLGKSMKVLVGLYRCAKFGCNQRGTFDNVQVLIFCEFGLQICLFLMIYRSLTPNVELYYGDPQRAPLVAKTCH